MKDHCEYKILHHFPLRKQGLGLVCNLRKGFSFLLLLLIPIGSARYFACQFYRSSGWQNEAGTCLHLGIGLSQSLKQSRRLLRQERAYLWIWKRQYSDLYFHKLGLPFQVAVDQSEMQLELFDGCGFK